MKSNAHGKIQTSTYYALFLLNLLRNVGRMPLSSFYFALRTPLDSEGGGQNRQTLTSILLYKNLNKGKLETSLSRNTHMLPRYSLLPRSWFPLNTCNHTFLTSTIFYLAFYVRHGSALIWKNIMKY